MSAATRGHVFISYRREEAGDVVGRLTDWLVRDKERVFLDLNMDPGLDFRDEIQREVSTCAVLLAVIGQDWLGIEDRAGRRRLDNADDMVRLEIETALRAGVPVIPVLIRGAQMPEKSQLPTCLAELADRNARELRNGSFSDDYKHLKAAIDRIVRSPPYARAITVLAGTLLVLAGASFAVAGRSFEEPRPVQIADLAAAVGLGVVAAALIASRSRWTSAGWITSVGVFIGASPFVAVRVWRSAALRGSLQWYALEAPISSILLALALLVLLVAMNPAAALAFPRVTGDSTATAVVCGVVAAVGLAAVGTTLPTSATDLATLKFSDPLLLFVAVLLALVVVLTRGPLRAAVLAGWASGATGVLTITVWLRFHPEFGIPGPILNAHLLLSVFTVVALACGSALVIRRPDPGPRLRER